MAHGKRRYKLFRKKGIDFDLARLRITFVGYEDGKPVIEVEERPVACHIFDVDSQGTNGETERSKS